jgi:hypothetical protein
MKYSILFLIISMLSLDNEKVRTIEYEGKEYLTTFDVPEKFLGSYRGEGEGYLTLNADGSGIYHYDIFFAPPECKKEPITIEWGFLLDEKNAIVSFNRKYGKSYPILLKSLGKTSFQGCRQEVMLDFLLDYDEGSLMVSSSDDWVKAPD